MPIPLRHDDHARAIARSAYETLEPLHLAAYFNPYLRDAAHEAGLSELALYIGARGGPLGDCAPAVVAATFFNFNPETVERKWQEAGGVGLTETMAIRERTVDRTLREALGDAVDSPELAQLAADLRHVTDQLPLVGRPLSAAWAALSWPRAPHLELWHATALLRESRGDGHVAALVISGLDPVEALVLHEAEHPDPHLRRRTMGKAALLGTRRWSEQQWDSATERLQDRDLLQLGTGSMTAKGAALFDALEAQTDDAAAAVWCDQHDAEHLLARARPFVKAFIDAGVLPGTRRRD
ncbi:SCO6745 family protein [Leekyejoonella antrihumi]|uniref:SalK n=1 Tax=Leekyejoonella antrihumi TaxID=1660198 RepID=A0A563E4T0_9MICO|nr:hypothetical protein [Leekyejoonella antrihumi]TWP37415.1 hypothetical protein FGL98_06615 [Leekyejoonella antrihumi]